LTPFIIKFAKIKASVFVITFGQRKSMTTEEKALIMKPLYALAEHYGLQDVATISFKKRELLLEKLKGNNEEAYALANTFILAQIKLDRIKNDKEKQLKNSEHWQSEILSAQEEASTSEKNLSEFFNNLS
jgi:outer membrane lipopolysaccharide assembly protein LptE/RlpB